MAYTAAAAIKVAQGQVGYRESGANDTRYNRWLGRIDGYGSGGYGYPWCASFQSWVADQAGGDANEDYPKTAGCAVAVAWFRKRGRWSPVPHVGDWVFYGPHGSTHVELVVAVYSSSIVTIGGNTSGSLEGRYYAGDGVYRKTVSRNSSRIYGYGRPAYEEDDVSAEDVWNYGIDTGDGKAKWRASTVLGHLEKEQDAIKAMVAGIAAKVGAPADVDEDAIVAGVLAGLTPERIAAAIPDELAEQVVTALGNRLAPKE